MVINMLFIIGLIIFLIILAGAVKYGNPNKYVQRKNNKNFTEDTVYELEQILNYERNKKQ